MCATFKAERNNTCNIEEGGGRIFNNAARIFNKDGVDFNFEGKAATPGNTRQLGNTPAPRGNSATRQHSTTLDNTMAAPIGDNDPATSDLAYPFQNVDRTHSLVNVDRVVARMDRVVSAMLHTTHALGLDDAVAQLAIDDWLRAATVDVLLDDPVSEYGFILAALFRVLNDMTATDRPDAIEAFDRVVTAELSLEVGCAMTAVRMTRNRVTKPEEPFSIHAYCHALCQHLGIGDWSDIVCCRARLATLLQITREDIIVVVTAVAFHVAQAVHGEEAVQVDDVLAAAIDVGRGIGSNNFSKAVEAIHGNQALVFHGLGGVLAPRAPAAHA